MDKQKLVQENRFNEKELLEIQKENLNYENLKKSETRAKNKTQKLKDEISTISQEFDQREQQLFNKIEELEGDKFKMELRLAENDKIVLELEHKNTEKDQEFLAAMEKISNLEDENQKVNLKKLRNAKKK